MNKVKETAILKLIRRSDEGHEPESLLVLASKKVITAQAKADLHRAMLRAENHSLAGRPPRKIPAFPVVPAEPYSYYVLRLGFNQEFGLNFDDYVKDWRVVVDPVDTYPGHLLLRTNNSAGNWMIVFQSLAQVGEGRTMLLYQQSRGNRIIIKRVIFDVVVEADRKGLEMKDLAGNIINFTMREYLG